MHDSALGPEHDRGVAPTAGPSRATEALTVSHRDWLSGGVALEILERLLSLHHILKIC